jgi:hypothetical protein
MLPERNQHKSGTGSKALGQATPRQIPGISRLSACFAGATGNRRDYSRSKACNPTRRYWETCGEPAANLRRCQQVHGQEPLVELEPWQGIPLRN